MESQPPAVTPDVPHVNPWIIAVSVMFATFLEVLDTTVVNVSLPHIAGSLAPPAQRGVASAGNLKTDEIL